MKKRLENYWLIYLYFQYKKSSEISNRSGLQAMEKSEKFLHPIMNKEKDGIDASALLFT